MLILPTLELLRPTTIADAVAALASAPGETRLLGGGTDLIPNLKQGLLAPRRLVSLRRIHALAAMAEQPDGSLVIGAGTTLATIAKEPRIRARYPALADAASLVASPQIRNVATLGGNLLLDTRCRWYNQSYFWRSALGFCLKKDGEVCHVVPKGQNCVATISADTPGPLLLYRATVRLQSARGERSVPIDELFVQDGVRNTVCAEDELLTAVVLPPPAACLRTAYTKVAVRQSIDFPIVSAAVALTQRDDGRVDSLTVVIGAIGSRPRVISGLEPLVGGPLDEALANAAADRAFALCRPLSTMSIDADWRRERIRTEVRRCFATLQPSR